MLPENMMILGHNHSKPTKEDLEKQIKQLTYKILYYKNNIRNREVKIERLKLDIEAIGLDIMDMEKEIERLDKEIRNIIMEEKKSEELEHMEVEGEVS